MFPINYLQDCLKCIRNQMYYLINESQAQCVKTYLESEIAIGDHAVVEQDCRNMTFPAVASTKAPAVRRVVNGTLADCLQCVKQKLNFVVTNSRNYCLWSADEVEETKIVQAARPKECKAIRFGAPPSTTTMATTTIADTVKSAGVTGSGWNNVATYILPLLLILLIGIGVYLHLRARVQKRRLRIANESTTYISNWIYRAHLTSNDALNFEEDDTASIAAPVELQTFSGTAV